MNFESIHLVNFKCYEDAFAQLHPHLNCIVGMNGAGKTNLMDALYYSCFGKSYFTSKDQFVIRKGASFMRLEAVVNTKDIIKLVIKVPVAGRKEIEIDDDAIDRISDHAGRFPAVMIAPDDNQIILGGSELRRKFMDGCISQYDHKYLDALLRYQKLLKQRNAVLRNFRKTGQVDPLLLDSLDDQMLSPAEYLYSNRTAFLSDFVPLFSERYVAIAGKQEATTIDHKTEMEPNSIGKLLAGSRQADLATGRTLTGPHRDDLLFTIDQSPVRSVGSQGQQKSFLVALKMAQYELIAAKRKIRPFLFLDDLFDKFDEHRVEHLVQLISEGYFGQVFITDTHEQRVSGIVKKHNLDHRVIKIDGATINYG